MSNGKKDQPLGLPPDKDVLLKSPADQKSAKPQPPDKEPGKKPDKYEGKSTEELREILTEQEKAMGKLSEKIDQFKGDVDYWRTKADATDRDRQLYGQNMPQTGAQPTQPQQQDQSQFNWERPAESVSSVVDQRLAQRDAVHAQEQVNRVIDEAKVAFNVGYDAAKRSNPRLFEGKDFEREIVDFMYNYYAPFAQKGIPVAHYLNNPKVWVKAAQSRRLDRNEYDRLQPEQIVPVSPTGTQIPDQAKPQSPEEKPVDLSPGAKQMVSWFEKKGYVKGEDEAAEMVREERKERAELEE